MNALKFSLISACLVLAAGQSMAADEMKKDDPMMGKTMTMQQCKDHMAMEKKDNMKKDDAMMKQDAMCHDMMKKDGMMKKDDMMKPDMAASGSMMKK